MSNLEKFKKKPYYSKLTDCQKRFFDVFFSGKNVFLSGRAGVGKSYCVSRLFDFAREEKLSMAKTASTGVAALNIGGGTLHSWSGIGLGDKTVDHLIKDAKRNKRAVQRMMYSKILVIDEISMVSADLFNKIDLVLKYFRENNNPFGGIQMCVVGDCGQLPPVIKDFDCQEHYFFESRAWKEGGFSSVLLEQVVRQDEVEFIQFLNNVRLGKSEGIEVLDQCINREFKSEIKPIKLFSRNVDVSKFNQSELDKIESPSKFFWSKDSGADHHIKFFDKNCQAPAKLELKIGASVMLLVNLDVGAGLVNGSIGKVTAFTTEGPEVLFTNGLRQIITPNTWHINEHRIFGTESAYVSVASREQIPLKVCYATTIHKSQGQTFDLVDLDLNEAFACGQAYTALSRVRKLAGLSVKPFNVDRIKASPKALRFYEQLEEENKKCAK